MKKDPIIYLNHILTSIQLVEKYMKGKTIGDLKSVTSLQDQVVRRLEIIGEASKQISTEYKSQHPQISWQDIIDFRNVLIHEYFGVDIYIVWDVMKRDLPTIKREIKSILKER